MKTAATNLVVTRNVSVKTLLEGLPIHGRGELEGARKKLFHNLGKHFFTDVATALHLHPKDYVVKSWDMDPSGSGEIWFHTTALFFQCSQDYMVENQSPVLIRRCVSLQDLANGIQYPEKDHQGLIQPILTKNHLRDSKTADTPMKKAHWMPLEALESVEVAVDWILSFKTRLMTGDA